MLVLYIADVASDSPEAGRKEYNLVSDNDSEHRP